MRMGLWIYTCSRNTKLFKSNPNSNPNSYTNTKWNNILCML